MSRPWERDGSAPKTSEAAIAPVSHTLLFSSEFDMYTGCPAMLTIIVNSSRAFLIWYFSQLMTTQSPTAWWGGGGRTVNVA